jgi:hypothetical protein
VCVNLSNQGRVPFWRSWGGFMIGVIFFFILLYGLRWSIEGILHANLTEAVIGFVVIIIVFAVYAKLWSKWRHWRRRASAQKLT